MAHQPKARRRAPPLFVEPMLDRFKYGFSLGDGQTRIALQQSLGVRERCFQ